MRFRKVALLAVAMLWSCSAFAQQGFQPLTFWSCYAVKPGKEADLMDLVKTVGQPVRDKAMADGVILAWGVDATILRGHESTTHCIWYDVADWASIEKVQNAMTAQMAKVNEDAAKAAQGGGKKNQKPAMTIMERARDIYDADKTKDFVTRDIVFGASTAPLAEGMLPYTRFNYTKVKPGKGAEYRAAWEKYNKPVLDKLVADGTVLAYGLTVEEVKTTSEITHFTWYAVKSMEGLDKVRSAIMADREHRSKEERDAISATFQDATDPDASRGEIDRALIIHVAPMK
jgi:hypothetical protein